MLNMYKTILGMCLSGSFMFFCSLKKVFQASENDLLLYENKV